MSATGPQPPLDETTVDLIIKQVTEGLSAAEQRALDATADDSTSAFQRDIERAAAALSVAGTTPVEVPAALRARLELHGERFLAAERGIAATRVPPSAATRPVAAPTGGRSARDSRRGWGWVAAAACLVLAAVGWLRPMQSSAPPTAEVRLSVPRAVLPPVELPREPPPPAVQRQALLARAESLKVTLGATKDPASRGVTGDVVWDPTTQTGFVHFAGLARNDPALNQYQIWIFDGTRDQRYPVDGGVFDVPADATEVVIPIKAALAIRTAKAFAVTLEKPGGVVVSGLAHVVMLGAAS